MSIQAVGWVLDHSTAEKGERLVLISLANHASADGTDAYPSVATMMKETKLPERNVQYALKALLKGAHIAKMGKAPDERIPVNRRPVNYRILGVPSTAPQPDQGCKNADSGVQDPPIRGAAGCTQTVLPNREEKTAVSAVEEEEPLASTEANATKRRGADMAPAKVDADTTARNLAQLRANRERLHGGAVTDVAIPVESREEAVV